MPIEPLAVAVLEALLQHPAQGGVQVAVVQEVVGHLREQGVGVEVEPDLRPVPAGVLERGLVATATAKAHVGPPVPAGYDSPAGARSATIGP